MSLSSSTSMEQVLAAYPGARRALFRKYHIGGCSSCGFAPNETLTQLAERNGKLNVEEVIAHIQSAAEADRQLEIAPKDVAVRRQRGEKIRLLDLRTREEWDAIHLEGADFVTQDLIQRLMGKDGQEGLMVFYDHAGASSTMRRRISRVTGLPMPSSCAAGLMRGRRKWTPACLATSWRTREHVGESSGKNFMNNEFQKRVEDAIANPQNMGEMTGADSIGTVGNADCGDMLRVWVKFKDENGRKVIDKASFQSFGCETAIAAASLAMELIRGKTPEEAMKMRGEEFAKDLGPLPPTKVHCTQLVEGAIRSALDPNAPAPSPKPVAAPTAPAPQGNLNESFNQPKQGGVRVVFLNQQAEQQQQQ